MFLFLALIISFLLDRFATFVGVLIKKGIALPASHFLPEINNPAIL